MQEAILMNLSFKEVNSSDGVRVLESGVLWFDWKRIKYYADLSSQGYETVMYWMPEEYVMYDGGGLEIVEMQKRLVRKYSCDGVKEVKRVLEMIAERLRPRYLGKAKEVLSFSSELQCNKKV